MPFVSKKQARWLFANKPRMAKEWASKTNFSELPLFKKKNVEIKRKRS